MSWYPRLNTGKLNYFRHLPKVDLHRHLEGSLRLSTLYDVARQHGITLPLEPFNSLVQLEHDDPLTFTNFLSKFQHLRQFYRSPEIIARLAQEAVEDAADDGVLYLELRFTPIALTRLQGFSLAEVMDWVAQSAHEAAQKRGLMLRLIVSVNRHEPVEQAETVARLAAERRHLGIVGLDLAGNEADFSAVPFAGIFRDAQQSGLHVTVHAGEWGGASNVREAIETLNAERVGHGVRVVDDPEVMALARERGVTFEVCITSNVQSGVFPSIEVHPITRMIRAGLRVTLNTDDPGIQRITLSDEYKIALEDMGLSDGQFIETVLNGARGAFLSRPETKALEDRLKRRLMSVL